MRVADFVVSGLLVLLACVVIYDAAQLGIGWGIEGPGSGFFPFWLATLLAVIGTVIFVRGLRRQANRPFVTRERFVPVAKVLAPLAAFVVLTDPPGPWPGVGLYVASGIYLAFYMRWVGRHEWRLISALSLSVPVIAFFIFEKWFLVPMPKGPIETWMGY